MKAKGMIFLKNIGVAALVLLLVQACKVGPNLKSHEVSLPADYVQDSLAADSAEVTDWWQLFDDPVLDSLIAVALDSNKNILMAAERMEQARLRASVARGEFGPKLNLQAQAARGNYFGLPGGGITDNFFAGANVAWELDFWGKIRRLNESAKAEYLSSAYAKRAAQVALIAEVATQYFKLLEYQKSFEIAQKTLELRQGTLDIIKARFEKGVIPEIDLNQSEIQYAIAEGAVPFYRQAVVQTQLALGVLLGQNPGNIPTGRKLEDLELENPLPPGLPAQLIARRPDVQQAWYAAVAQNAYIGVAQANRLPAISITGTLGIAGNDFGNVSLNPAWNLGAGLLGPLFYWNQNLRRVDIERSATKAALYNYENQVLIALAEVEGALVDINTNEEIIEANARREASATNALFLSDQRYQRGVTSYLEYLEQQRQAFDAQLALASSRSALLISYMQLYKALGGGWISEAEKNENGQAE